MGNKDLLCVIDASVLIDLIYGGILVEFQSLPITILVPDIVKNEVEEDRPNDLDGLDSQIIEFTGEQVSEVIEMRKIHRNISTPDLFAYIGAREKTSILLTGDKKLRTLAEGNGMIVHGILWILDELLRLNIIVQKRASFALREIIINGSYLPKGECVKRFKQWGEEDDFCSGLF